jgi:hypothetical protein
MEPSRSMMVEEEWAAAHNDEQLIYRAYSCPSPLFFFFPSMISVLLLSFLL